MISPNEANGDTAAESPLAAAFGALLPNDVVVEVAGPHREPAPLPPGEAQAVENAVPKRQREFALGRDCAHRALARLGVPATEVLAAPTREPLWPAEVRGSITHCSSVAAAAVGHAARWRGLGIDAEPDSHLAANLLPIVCREDERAWIDGRTDDLPWGKLFFSAKESVYKCVFPAARVFLEFEDVALRLSLDGEFEAKFRLPGIEAAQLEGRWAVASRCVLTTAVLRSGLGQAGEA